MTAVTTIYRNSTDITGYGYCSALVGSGNVGVATRQGYGVAAKVENAVSTGAVERGRRYNSPIESSGAGNRLPASRCLEGENLSAVTSISYNLACGAAYRHRTTGVGCCNVATKTARRNGSTRGQVERVAAKVDAVVGAVAKNRRGRCGSRYAKSSLAGTYEGCAGAGIGKGNRS